jgi:hypothetical protein
MGIEGTTISIEREEDLDRSVGGIVKVRGMDDYDKISQGLRAHEGLKDGKDSFLMQRPSDKNVILSVRSYRKYLQFGANPGEWLSEVVLDHLHYNIVHYSPESPAYEDAKKLLIKNKLWEEPEKSAA